MAVPALEHTDVLELEKIEKFKQQREAEKMRLEHHVESRANEEEGGLAFEWILGGQVIIAVIIALWLLADTL